MSATAEQDARLRAAIEHTLLAAEATERDIERLCDEATNHGLFGVCVNPVHVPVARARLGHATVQLVSVVGFPLGATASEVKAHEATLVVAAGADELDMVLALGAARAGDWSRVQADIEAVVASAQGRPVKVIVETAKLEDDEKRLACHAARRAGAAFVKTSTGFGGGGATEHDVALMHGEVGGVLGVKASGGIRTRAQALQLLHAGATRVGTSAGPALLLPS